MLWFERKKNQKSKFSSEYALTGLLFCGDCMARTLYMIKELTDKLDAYGVEPS